VGELFLVVGGAEDGLTVVEDLDEVLGTAYPGVEEVFLVEDAGTTEEEALVEGLIDVEDEDLGTT
jgi:hypothetical protein